MKKFALFIASVLMAASFVGVPALVSAQPDLGLEYGGATELGSEDPRTTIANIIRVALGFLGIVAIIIVLYGGVLWMTAAGNDERVSTAKKVLFSGVIGLVIILTAYAVTNFVLGELISATT